MGTSATRLSAVVVLFVAALLGLTACGEAEAPPAPAPAAPATPKPTGVQEFVGPVGDGSFYVAFALAPGGGVEAYLCNGTGRAENFTGTVSGDQIQLTSADGDSTITATTSAEKVTGTVVIAGQPSQFTVPKTTGVGGLYDLDVTSQGENVLFTGASRGGNVLTATITGPTAATGTITLTGGTTTPLDPMAGTSPTELNGFEAYRVLIADDGTRRGNPKPGAKKSSSGGGSFTCPLIIG